MVAGTLANEVFFDGRDFPGRLVLNPPSLARPYNIKVLLTRFLMDSVGRIATKVCRECMAVVYQDVAGDQ